MNSLSSYYGRICGFAALTALSTTAISAAVLNVPSQSHSNLFNALAAAQSGDEIRVANNYIETEAWLETSGKTVTITSYTPDFSAPAPGAQWDTVVLGGINDALLTIANGSITIEGFSMLRATDGNVFFLNSDANLTVRDCTFTGVGRADTAGIKTGSGAQNVSVTLEGTNVVSNGRGIWFNQISGTSSLIISDCVFEDNASYPIEWRTNRGNHQLEMRDTFYSVRNNRASRLYTFNTVGGELATNHILFERCEFVSAPTGRTPILLSGVDDTADPASTTTLTVRNSTFDLRQGEDLVDTVAVDVLESAARRSQIDFDHNTVVLTGANQCGIRFREHQSTCYVRNSIIDAGGEGRVALRSLRGTTISYRNLLNVVDETQSFLGGSVILSGDELIDVSAEFVDWTNSDFHLQSTSPALAYGDNLGITDDLFGSLRPNPAGSDPDLGAIEMADSASVPDWAVY